MADGLQLVASKGNGYLRISLGGNLDVKGASEHYRTVTQLADETACGRILLDARAVAGRAEIPDIFDFMVRTYPATPGGRRTAALDLPQNLVRARFFEHLMQNNGRCYRLFFDEAEATSWLLSNRS